MSRFDKKWDELTDFVSSANVREKIKLDILKKQEFIFKGKLDSIISKDSYLFVKYNVIPKSFVVMRRVGEPQLYLKCDIAINEFKDKSVGDFNISDDFLRVMKDIYYQLFGEITEQITHFNKLIALDKYYIIIDDVFIKK